MSRCPYVSRCTTWPRRASSISQPGSDPSSTYWRIRAPIRSSRRASKPASAASISTFRSMRRLYDRPDIHRIPAPPRSYRRAMDEQDGHPDYRALLQPLFEGRRVILTGGPVAAFTPVATLVHELGAAAVLCIGTDGV